MTTSAGGNLDVRLSPSPMLLADTVTALQRASISPLEFANTERDWRFFCQWTERHGRESLPASPLTVVLFLFSQREHWGWRSSRSVASRVGRVHEWADQVNPCHDELVRGLLSSVARDRGRRQEPRTSPIRAQDAAAILAQPPQREGLHGAAVLLERRDRAALVLGLIGQAPLRQLARVGRTDVRNGVVEVLLPACRAGGVALPPRHIRLTRRGGALCPVAAVEQLLEVLPEKATLLLGVVRPSTKDDAIVVSPEPARVFSAVASSLRTVARRAGLLEAWDQAQRPNLGVALGGRRVLMVGLDPRQAEDMARLVKSAEGVPVTETAEPAAHFGGFGPASYAFAVMAAKGRTPAVTGQLAASGVQILGLREAAARLHPPSQHVGAGLSDAQVERLSMFCDTDLLRQTRDRAYLLVGLALCRRHVELRELTGRHVTKVEGGFRVTVPPTKNRRTSTKIPNVLFLERTGGPACPATALSNWLDLLDDCGQKGASLPVFPAIRHGVPAGPLPTESASMSKYLRRLVGTVDTIVSAGFMLEGTSLRISTRSMRVGGIVTLTESGADTADIAATSLHDSVEQLAVYLRFEDPFAHAHHLNV